jgi:hypothetical protein
VCSPAKDRRGGQAVVRAPNVVSGTCRRKPRLEGRHTSDGVCAAAQSKQAPVGFMSRAWPISTKAGKQGGRRNTRLTLWSGLRWQTAVKRKRDGSWFGHSTEQVVVRGGRRRGLLQHTSGSGFTPSHARSSSRTALRSSCRRWRRRCSRGFSYLAWSTTRTAPARPRRASGFTAVSTSWRRRPPTPASLHLVAAKAGRMKQSRSTRENCSFGWRGAPARVASSPVRARLFPPLTLFSL